MDEAYQKVVKRKKELEAELAEVNLFLRLYCRYVGTEGEHRESENGVESTPFRHPFVDFARQRGNPEIVATMAEAILKDMRRPMTRGELAVEIERRGTTLPAGDKAKYVGTILWRKSGRFENIEGLGYWLRGFPIPRADEFDLTGKVGP